MIGIVLAFVSTLADALPPEPVRVAAAKSSSDAGLYVAGLAGVAAVTLVAVLVRRRRGRE